MTPSQLYQDETHNGKLKAEIKQMLGEKALNRYEAEELIQLIVLNELDRPRKIYPTEIKKIKENPNLTPNEKLDIISTLYTNNGYSIVERDRLSIQLFKKKKFSYLSAFLWFLLLGVGLVIYVLYHLFRGDHNETIFVDDNYKAKPEGIVEEPIIILPNEEEDEEIEGLEETSENEEEQVEEFKEEELLEEESSENIEEDIQEEATEETNDELEEVSEEEELIEKEAEELELEEVQEESLKEDK